MIAGPARRPVSRALNSVRARTTFVATAAFAIAFIAAAYTLVRVVDRRVQDSERRTANAALQVAYQQFQTTNTIDIRGIDETLRTPVYVQIYDGVTGDRVDGLSSRSLARVGPGGSIERIDSRFMMIRQRVTLQADQHPGWLVVASPVESANRGIAALRRGLLIATPALTLLVAVIVWWLVGRALLPVERIRREVESISSRTIDRRVPVPTSDDEIARLAETMNAMLHRLETAQLRQREFVSDASHELRSPISSMRTELEVALAHPALTDWTAMAGRVLEEDNRLERLVGDLLQLARLDEGRPLRIEDVDLDDVVLTEAAHARPVPVRTGAVSAGRIRGERRVLEMVVRNLIDNAAHHADTQVAVGVQHDDGRVVLTVDDDGDGVPPAERERIFERFARVDDGRSRNDGGAGLGLALVRRVVTAHDGTVVCTDSPFGGARFEVRLPAT